MGIYTINPTTGRATLDQPLFNEEELASAMQQDESITHYFREIYRHGITSQESNDTVSEAQAKAINITHKKIEKALAEPNKHATNAERVDQHLGNLIGELQALRSLFKEMQ